MPHAKEEAAREAAVRHRPDRHAGGDRPIIPDAHAGARPRKATSRELVDAILYFLRVGVAWRLPPHDLPPWQTVYYCTDGRLLTVRVHAADVQNRDGGKLPLKSSRQHYPLVARVFSDGGYAGRLVHRAAEKTHIALEIIRRGARAKSFEVLPRRWVVERTSAWIFKNRRLVRDYEQLTAVAKTLVTIDASATLLRRWM